MSARVICTGSREWRNRQAVQDALADLGEQYGCDLTIVVGYDPVKRTPRGADRFVYEEAQKHGFRIETHPADWENFSHEDFERFGYKGAGRRRNQAMADAGADLCVAFWDGRSSGTKDMTDRALKAGIPLWWAGVFQQEPA